LTRLRGQTSQRDSSLIADSNALGQFILTGFIFLVSAKASHTFLANSCAQFAVIPAYAP
jgi:hypothetical protein